MKAIKKIAACLLVAAMLFASGVCALGASMPETPSEPTDLLPYRYARD